MAGLDQRQTVRKWDMRVNHRARDTPRDFAVYIISRCYNKRRANIYEPIFCWQTILYIANVITALCSLISPVAPVPKCFNSYKKENHNNKQSIDMHTNVYVFHSTSIHISHIIIIWHDSHFHWPLRSGWTNRKLVYHLLQLKCTTISLTCVRRYCRASPNPAVELVSFLEFE